jgi:hypothetical protein
LDSASAAGAAALFASSDIGFSWAWDGGGFADHPLGGFTASTA